MGFTREFFRFFPQFSARVELMGFATINISGTAKGLNLKFAHKMYIRTNIQKMQKKKLKNLQLIGFTRSRQIRPAACGFTSGTTRI